MESFSLKKLWNTYVKLFYKDPKGLQKRVISRLVLPFIISLIVLFNMDNISNVKNTISVALSILVGLLFNFVSSFSGRIRSEHLNQNASEKIKRLQLIRETSDGAFVTIFLSILGLGSLLILSIVSGNSLFNYLNLERWIKLIIGCVCLTLLYQIFLMLIYMINRLRKLIKVDTDQEKQYLKSKQKKEIDDFEEFID